MRLVSLLAATTLAIAPQAAFAACELVSDGRGAVPNELFEQKNAPTDSTAMASLLYGQLVSRGPVLKEQCTVEQYVTAFNRLNPSYAADKPMLIPVLNAAPASASKVEVPQVALQPATVMSPEVERLQAKVAKLEAAITAFEKSPSAKNAEGTQLLEKAKAELKSTYTALQAELAKKADKSYVDEQLGLKADQSAVNAALQGKADADKVYTKEEMDEKLENLPAGEGLPFWSWLLIAVGVIGGILCLLAYFRKVPESGTNMGGVSDVSLRADLDALKEKVDAIDNRFNHTVRRTAETQKPAALKALADGSELEYPLDVDGQLIIFKGRVVQHAQSGDAVIKIDELSKPVTASKLFAELATYIENGGQLPTLRVVS